ARGVPEMDVDAWTDIARVDVKPGKGMVKIVAKNNWETQIDAATGEVLQVAYRRSDVIEALHDGSFFADWAKLYLFLPAGLVLAGLWGTGIYLFVLPQWKKAQKRARKSNAVASAPARSAP
ncbi:MAG: hypothetical protein AAGC56_14335, partial [Pseudomonadota bacterium]